MVVVDELHDAVVEPLVVGNVGVGRVDRHRLARDLGEGAALLHSEIDQCFVPRG